MRIRRTGRRDEAALERLLDAAAAGEKVGTDPLHRLLSSAAAPAGPGELAGEEAAVAAFRQAIRTSDQSVGASAGRVGAAGRWGRRLTAGAVAWAAVGAATVTAGVALAAGTHVLDINGPDPGRTPSTAPTSGAGQTTPTSPAPSSSGPVGGPTPTPALPSAVAAQLRGLCTRYLAEDPAQREKALREPTLRRLAEAAGGVAAIEAYCQRITAGAPGDHPAKPPGQQDQAPASGTVNPSVPAGPGIPSSTPGPASPPAPPAQQKKAEPKATKSHPGKGPIPTLVAADIR